MHVCWDLKGYENIFWPIDEKVIVIYNVKCLVTCLVSGVLWTNDTSHPPSCFT